MHAIRGMLMFISLLIVIPVAVWSLMDGTFSAGRIGWTIGGLLLFFATYSMRNVVVQDHQRGLQYRDGRFIRTVGPGQHWAFGGGTQFELVDIRTRYDVLSGQDLICRDGVSAKLSLIAVYNITDPYLAVSQVADYRSSIHFILQSALREAVSALSLEELMADRDGIPTAMAAAAEAPLATIGIQLSAVYLRDIMLSGQLRQAFAAELEARLESKAALEKARGEAAVMRNMLNTAKLLEQNPQLVQLRMLQSMQQSTGNTIVFDVSGQMRAQAIRDGSRLVDGDDAADDPTVG